MREIALDTETTGLSYANGDRIIEIGCVEIIDKHITGNTYHVYLNPEREISAESSKITGLTFDMLKKYKLFKDEYENFLEFIKNDRLVIHNAPFDIGFLNNELRLVNAKELQMTRVIDTLVMARRKYPGSPATLDALCKKFEVDNSIRSKHGALIDAELLAHVYNVMSVEKIQKNLFSNNISTKNTNINKDVILVSATISPEELDIHKKFASNLKNNLWYSNI